MVRILTNSNLNPSTKLGFGWGSNLKILVLTSLIVAGSAIVNYKKFGFATN